MNNNTSVRQSILPSPQYADLRLPNGKLAGRYDPTRGLLEVQTGGIKHYFDLTQFVKPVDKINELCYDSGQQVVRQGNKKGAMMGDSRKPYPEYTCTKNDDGSYTHTFNYESNDDSLSDLYCTFCQQEERR